MNKKLFAQVLVVFFLLPGATQAEEEKFPGEFSGSLTLVSDYRFRGISQTRENPALQAALDYQHPFGFKAGLWASNVDFDTAGEGRMELDVYGAYAWKLEPVNFEAGMYYYAYPAAATRLHYEYPEAYATASYTLEPVTFTAAFNYTWDNGGNSGNAYYPQLAFSVSLPHEFMLDGAVGRQWVDRNAAFGLPDYTTWAIGLARDWEGFTGKLQYVDTNIGNGTCGGICGAAVVASVSKSF